jgi:hypothetical protein
LEDPQKAWSLMNALFVFLSGMLCDVLVDEIEKATTGFFTAV